MPQANAHMGANQVIGFKSSMVAEIDGALMAGLIAMGRFIGRA
jgi:hypothetical protein